MSTDKEDAIHAVRIAAAHHLELVELAQAEAVDLTSAILDAGDVLDVALVLAFDRGVKIFELWRAAKLPVRYIAALTSGAVDD